MKSLSILAISAAYLLQSNLVLKIDVSATEFVARVAVRPAHSIKSKDDGSHESSSTNEDSSGSFNFEICASQSGSSETSEDLVEADDPWNSRNYSSIEEAASRKEPRNHSSIDEKASGSKGHRSSVEEVACSCETVPEAKEVAEFSSGDCSILSLYERIRVTDTLKLEYFYHIGCLLKKMDDLQLIKRLDIRIEDSLPKHLKNAFKNLLAKLNEDAAIKLIPKQSMYYDKPHELLSDSSGTSAYRELLKYLSSLRKKNPIDLDCLFFYSSYSKHGNYGSNYGRDRSPSAFGSIFEGLDLPQVRSLSTLEKVYDVVKLEKILPNLEHVIFAIFLFDEKDLKDLNQLSVFKKLKSIECQLPLYELHPKIFDCGKFLEDLSFLDEVLIKSNVDVSIVGSCKTQSSFKLRLKGRGKSLSSLVEKLNEEFFKGSVVLDPETSIQPQMFPNLNISMVDPPSIRTKRAIPKK